jgi:3-methyladenine DNA glycosylase AlkD
MAAMETQTYCIAKDTLKGATVWRVYDQVAKVFVEPLHQATRSKWAAQERAARLNKPAPFGRFGEV